MVNPESLVKVRNLSFRFGSRIIFDDVNLDFMKGKVTAIMGPSGTGKTTLLRLIGGQLRQNAGSIVVDGAEVIKMSRKELYNLRKRIGLMFQSGALFTGLSVFDNVAYPIREHTSLPESMIRDLVFLKLEAVGLRGACQLMPSELSGGMARRVALARTIALDPMMIMYDEPFTGQDPITVAVIMKLIRELNDNLGLTSIIVSHDVHEVSAISDYIYLVSAGKVVGRGVPGELEKNSSEWVNQFLNGLPDGPVPYHYPATDYYQDLFVDA
ncbi:MAG: ABC transporter ATP-binding protein [Gammaproteobacteria bacterium]